MITALTAQNTRGVTAIHAPDAGFVSAQLDAVFDDIRIDAVKIGMLANASIVRAVADALRRHKPAHIVLDTVMISKSNHALLLPDAGRGLARRTAAACRSAGRPIRLKPPRCSAARSRCRRKHAMLEQGEALRALGARAVLMKGGYLNAADSPDWLVAGERHAAAQAGPRVPVKNTHGTGCTLSSAIAALIPQRGDLASAVADAKEYLTGALQASDRLDVGSGVGPVHHFYRWW